MPGWLSDTLRGVTLPRVALLNIDVDWYACVLSALQQLFPRVVPGGIVNIDDYGRWSGCDAAVHDFLDSIGYPITALRRTTQHSGAWLRTPRDD